MFKYDSVSCLILLLFPFDLLVCSFYDEFNFEKSDLYFVSELKVFYLFHFYLELDGNQFNVICCDHREMCSRQWLYKIGKFPRRLKVTVQLKQKLFQTKNL